MDSLIFSGPVPAKLRIKAKNLLIASELKTGIGWKKIRGLREWFSFRLNNNYRVLATLNGPFLVCNHDIYQKKIRYLKKQG